MISPDIGDGCVGIAIIGIGRLSGPPNQKIELDKELGQEDFDVAQAALRAVDHLTPGFTTELLGRNFARLENTYRYVEVIAILERRYPAGDRRKTMMSPLSSALINFASGMRLYLDHQETSIKRRFGKDSQQAQRFTQVTATAYDGRFGYAFTYKLRNYCVHCGVPR